MKCYEIRDWNKHFEKSDTRRCKSMSWIAVPNRMDGKGYRRIAAHPRNVEIFAAWILICEIASKMPVRGVLRDEDGPVSPEDMAFMTGYPESIFVLALPVLVLPRIGWLVVNGGKVGASTKTFGRAGSVSRLQDKTEQDRTF